MTKRLINSPNKIDRQAAEALMMAAAHFLVRQGVAITDVRNAVLRSLGPTNVSFRPGKELQRRIAEYEDMGSLLSTWYTDTRFLDDRGGPVPLTAKPKGRGSVGSLVRAARVRTSPEVTVHLLHISPSIKLDEWGRFIAIKRAFVLPNFEVPRAALVVGRFLETLHKNKAGSRKQIPLLLERCCYVTRVNGNRIAPLLRDIKIKGVAFMDSVDGEIEAQRIRKSSGPASGEMGVVTFAWIEKNRRNCQNEL